MENSDQSPPPLPPPPPTLQTRDCGEGKAEPSSSPPLVHFVHKAKKEPVSVPTVRLRPGSGETYHVGEMYMKLVLRPFDDATPENLSIPVTSDTQIRTNNLRCKFCKKGLTGTYSIFKIECGCTKIAVAHEACLPSQQVSEINVCATCGQPPTHFRVLLLRIPVPAQHDI